MNIDSRNEILELLQMPDETFAEEIIPLAEKTAEQTLHRKLRVTSMMGYTNICKNNCLYCGMRAGNPSLPRYRIPPEHVAVVPPAGDGDPGQWYREILDLPYDHIFFTGSERVGKEVMAAAVKHLTPVTLELGGKSPVIVDGSADLALAARRIAWGKCLNAGQTCVAPDYVLVQRKCFDGLVEQLKKQIVRLYGKDPLAGSDLPRIISDRHFDRLIALIDEERAAGTVLFGGTGEKEKRRIAPTLIGPAGFDSPTMREEIFGPLLPIIPFDDLSGVIERLQARPLPLALYLFTRDKGIERRVIGSLRFGGGCVNDTVVHLANPRLPFGGVGASGMGSYHGRAGFDTVSRVKSVLKKGLWLDLPFRYPPYKELFFRVVRAAFNQRRKTLVNALSALGDKAAVREAVLACSLPETVRGEKLDFAAFAALTDQLARRL